MRQERLRFMQGISASTNHSNSLATIKRSVANCAVTDTLALKFCNSRQADTLAGSACGQNHTVGRQLLLSCRRGESSKGLIERQRQNLIFNHVYT